MSRLDSHIRRLLAQRACIDSAATFVADLQGPVLELGLGNGRTFDHLRERFPGRAIFVFDYSRASHPDSRPEPSFFIQGDFRDTLPTALSRIGSPAVLAHCDFGSHQAETTRRLAIALAPLLAPLVAAGGIVLSDQEMTMPGWTEMPLPEGIEPGRYYMSRLGGGPGGDGHRAAEARELAVKS
jgi:hypothetical protein